MNIQFQTTNCFTLFSCIVSKRTFQASQAIVFRFFFFQNIDHITVSFERRELLYVDIFKSMKNNLFMHNLKFYILTRAVTTKYCA